ncbi:HNH endonuclease [Azomonas macrocytogenes]|uniref:Putative restriction endonuclease n=1 Tax=Azomonas macrocytogenes TaxID=69962 RepID=A0A839T5L3_AZOMA|nr:HNH endonuclease signature motif containing protein [Azomonas macrocytogenes]MBB3103776.1 putative restriction endonuclease [Azomonas macrocytogenes]
MKVETVKEEVWNLAEEINRVLGYPMITPTQQPAGDHKNKNISLIGNQGRLYIRPASGGYWVALSGASLVNKMHDFMCNLTHEEKHGYYHKHQEREPYWFVSDYQQVRKAAYFYADIDLSKQAHSFSDLDQEFQDKVLESLREESSSRQDRIAKASKLTAQIQVIAVVFLRNPDVVAEALFRASGTCERCQRAAPFNRKSDGTPYLEVHHIKRLADGGEDTLENVLALCPNCHRELHYGDI